MWRSIILLPNDAVYLTMVYIPPQAERHAVTFHDNFLRLWYIEKSKDLCFHPLLNISDTFTSEKFKSGLILNENYSNSNKHCCAYYIVTLSLNQAFYARKYDVENLLLPHNELKSFLKIVLVDYSRLL